MRCEGGGAKVLPNDYEERVYAGVLGKIIGVYLGRPFEGWPNERIEQRLGEIDYYVHDKVGVRLIVTDDDISGTFTFIRALEDYNFDPQLTPKQVGQTWLNYLIDGRSVLWWGGLGNSTEHTAYLRLTQGIDAPLSGAISTNGQVVAEQIGAQIFIDGWAMVSPGDPEQAADFARRAGSVSHDGEAVYGAQVLAAMEAQAFIESDIDKLIDAGVAQIPKDSTIYGMIEDIREWHQRYGDDWRGSFKEIQGKYGYDKYGGNCHIVPNHGLIVLGLLHGDGDFSKSLMIVNTAGWDTDCNSGNLGCLMGIRNGLEGIDAGPDWRGPFADICYVPTADSGGGISDAVTQAQRIIRAGQRLQGVDVPPPKDGARFHFSYPGSIQGFRSENANLENVSLSSSERCLAIRLTESSETGAFATTNTFIESLETAEYFGGRGYGLMTSPSLATGQIVTAKVVGDEQQDVAVAICVGVYDKEDKVGTVQGEAVTVSAGSEHTLSWTVPDTDGFPIANVGLAIKSNQLPASIYLRSLDWSGVPTLDLTRHEGTMWRRAWVNAVDTYHPFWGEPFRLIHNHGTGLLLYGSRSWDDYTVSADLTPHLAKRAGICIRVQGMRRYYGLVLTEDHKLQLVKELDGTTILAELGCDMELGRRYDFSLTVNGSQITGSVGDLTLHAEDRDLDRGGIGLLIDEGRTATQAVSVRPV